jgi:hypothetical protein
MGNGTNLWDAIDPSNQWRVAPEGGYTSTDDTPSAGYTTQATQAAAAPIWSPKNEHFGFLVLVTAIGGGLYWLYEGKGSGASLRGNVGPLEGELGAGIGKE